MIASLKHSFRLLSKEKVSKTSDFSQEIRGHIPTDQSQDEMESDSKKRSFLKLAGVVGAGAIAASLLPRKAEALVFGSSPTSSIVGLKDHNNSRIDPAQETGGNLATINTNTAPFVAAGAGGYVRQDSTATIAKETGGNLATVATNTGTISTNTGTISTNTGNIATSTSTLATNIPAKGLSTMSGSMPVVIASDQAPIPISGTILGSTNPIGLKDTTGTQINPATDDSAMYLRRIVKLMESQAVVDSSNRQRMTLDAITGSLTLSTVSNVTTVASQGQQMYQDVARNTFANGLRKNFIFS